MIDINWVVENETVFRQKMLKRNLSLVAAGDYHKKIISSKEGAVELMGIDHGVNESGNKNGFCVEYIIGLDLARKSILSRLEEARFRVNKLSEEIAITMREAAKNGDLAAKKNEIEQIKQNSIAIGASIPKMEHELRVIMDEIRHEMSRVPNLVDDEVPNGESEKDNIEISRFGHAREFNFAPREHHEIGLSIGMLNFDVGSKVSGTRTNFMFGEIARLHRALVQFMLDVQVKEHGFNEVMFPVLLRPSALYCTGQLSAFNFSNDLFHMHNVHMLEEENDKSSFVDDAIGAEVSSDYPKVDGLDMIRDVFLSPTGEVQLVNVLSGATIDEDEAPIRLVGYSECFRKEAGAGGRDIKGIIRQKQFGKVELVTICKPQDSEVEHEKILSSAENVLRALDLHYRVVLLCAGDMGFSSRKTYDIEVWLPAQKKYREISSCSNTGDFQARRAMIKIASGKKKHYAHTLNGSGLAVGRTMVAILENYQNEDGSISVPTVLVPYMGGLERIEASHNFQWFKHL